MKHLLITYFSQRKRLSSRSSREDYKKLYLHSSLLLIRKRQETIPYSNCRQRYQSTYSILFTITRSLLLSRGGRKSFLKKWVFILTESPHTHGHKKEKSQIKDMRGFFLELKFYLRK